MKKLPIAGAALMTLIGTSAFAADMAVKAPPMAPAAAPVAKAAPDGRWREHCCSRHLPPVGAYYGVSPYMALSWPWAKARAGGISILPPMISI